MSRSNNPYYLSEQERLGLNWQDVANIFTNETPGATIPVRMVFDIPKETKILFGVGCGAIAGAIIVSALLRR